MKNSLVLTLTSHELIHILYAHFLTKGAVKLNQYTTMRFTLVPDGTYRCELFSDMETDILKPEAEEHEKKRGRMIRIDETK